MELSEFKTILEAIPDHGPKLFEFFTQAVEAEKSRGISEVSKRNKEAEGLRKFKLALESAGYTEGTDLNEFIGGLKAAKEDASSKTLTLKDLQTQLTSLQSSFDKSQTELLAERTAATELRTKAKTEKLRAVLTSSLADKVYGHDFVISDLISSGKVDLQDDKPIFKNGDQAVDIETGIKGFLDSRPDLIKSQQTPGGSAKPNGGTPPGPNTDENRLSRLRNLAGGIR